MDIFELKNVNKTFGKKEVLKDVNLKVKQGEKIAILGPNGSGKSTLMNVILGLKKPTKGEIKYPFFNNKRINFTKEVGMQFQSGNFPNNFKVKEIIDIVFEQKSDFKYKDYRSFKKEAKKKIEEYVEIFKLKKVYKSKVKNLSGGEKQRLNILLAIISNPKVLILDEISTGLDIKSQKQLIKFIEDYSNNNEVTLIIISHIVYEIEQLADSVAMLDEGEIKFKKDLKSLISKYGDLSKALDKYFIEGKKVI